MSKFDASVTQPRGPSGEHDVSAAATNRSFDGGAPPSAVGSQPGMRVDAYIGQTLEGRYYVESLLGEGGMGVVYLARHTVIDKRVAIKILRSDLATDQEMTERFMNEARSASSIGNPHIVDISDFGRLADGSAYFVMEYLDGVSLAKLMDDERAVPVPRLIHISKQIARGLAAAHARGIVHRDLKPDNVMLVPRGEDRDFVKILDFGIAKVGGEAGRLTRAGSVFGTPHYMSPEQAAGVPVDMRTDIYALGVILYEMASGKVPFDADNFMGILTQHMYRAPAPIRAIVPQAQEVPPGLEAVVLKALSKKVDLRYQTMEEVVADLDRVQQGAVPNAVPEMMARSGGFNVPADYFRNPARGGGAFSDGRGGAAMMPATPLQRKRRGILLGAVIGAVLVVGAVTAALLVLSIGSNVNATPERTSVVPSSVAAPSAIPAVAVPAKVSVIVTTEPSDATIALEANSADLPAPAPRWIDVAEGETVALRVEHAGYKTQRYSLDLAKVTDAKHPRATVKLEREPPPRPGVAVAAKTAPPPPKPTAPVVTATPPPVTPPSPTPPQPTCPLSEQDPWTKKCR